MNKIDLIIDALELYTTKPQADHLGMYVLHNCCGQEIKHGHHEDCLGVKALAAARELQALKPVMEQAKESLDLAQSLLENSRHHQQILYAYLAVKHALDEVTK